MYAAQQTYAYIPDPIDEPPYERQVKFPKWTGRVGVRLEPRVLRRFAEFADWRKPDHFVAALASAYASADADRRYQDAIRSAFEAYGEGNGVLISGIVRGHFPPSVKDRLRMLCQYAGLMSDVSFAHWRMSGRRRETWQRVRAEVQS